jgi:hypothetical protein
VSFVNVKSNKEFVKKSADKVLDMICQAKSQFKNGESGAFLVFAEHIHFKMSVSAEEWKQVT